VSGFGLHELWSNKPGTSLQESITNVCTYYLILVLISTHLGSENTHKSSVSDGEFFETLITEILILTGVSELISDLSTIIVRIC